MPTLSATNQNVTLLSTQSTVLECLPSNSNLSVRWVLYQTDGSRIPITSAGDTEIIFTNDIIAKRTILPSIQDIETEFPYHNLTITYADVSFHSGVYVCSIVMPPGDTTVISRNITVNVLPGQ